METALTNLTGIRLVAVLIAVLSIISCSESPQPMDNDKEIDKKKIARHKPGSSFSDTIQINIPAAVFFKPDSLQLEKIKEVTDPSTFESTMHECFYQIKNSRSILKQYYTGVEIIETANARYLLFRKVDGTIEHIDLNALNDPCGMVIFDGRKDPQLVDMTNVESTLGFYFSK